MDRELQRCPSCGAEKLAAGNQWCKCNPDAPFRMVPASVSETLDALFKSLEDKERDLARVRRFKQATKDWK